MADSETRAGSGKQILLRILSTLATTEIADEDLDDATRRLRAGLLLRGSTSDDSYDQVRRLAWITARDADGEIVRQGVGTSAGRVLLADVVETLLEMPGLEAFVRSRHPNLTTADVEACAWATWMIVSSVQMFAELRSVETDGEIDVDRWVESYTAKYRRHFLDRGVDPD